ncbi:unnamed protein product [Jaminaea pallidilutea]
MPASTDPNSLTTPAAVRRALSELTSHSRRLDDAIETVTASSLQRVNTSQTSIAALAPQVELLSEEAKVLESRLVDASKTSDRISGAVRRLDEERKRIRIASAWVQWVQDLKASLASLASAIDQGDWELATRHTQKAMATPQEVIESEFARRVVPSTEQPLPPSQTLETLRTQLLNVFTQRFKQAIQAKEQAEASRFFKMLPQIGWRAEGLAAYCDFAQGMIREKGKAILEATTRGGTAVHSQLLTALFEQLALLISTHQPVVDRHYGPGNFAIGVMPGLQAECDSIGGRIVDSWMEKTAAARMLQDARAFIFHFLANLGTSSSSSNRSKQGPGSASVFGLPGRPGTPSGPTRPGTPMSAVDENQGPDGRDVDRLLGELAAMASRWATYRQFLQDRLSPAHGLQSSQEATGTTQPSEGELKDFRRGSVDSTMSVPAHQGHGESREEGSVTAQSILSSSALAAKLDGLLEDIYCPLERWYLRSSLEKAHRIDSPDLSARPLSSSVLDDAFFLLRSSLTRILSTCHLTTITSSIRSVRTIADDDYIQVLVRRMESTWRNAGGALAGPDGPRKESATREMRTQYVLYLNVLNVSATYAERILSDLSSERHLGALSLTDSEYEETLERVRSLEVVPSRLRSAQKTEMEHLFNQITRGRIRSLLTDTFKGVSYDITSDADFQEIEFQDVVRKRFIRGWEALVLNPFSQVFNESNFEEYLNLCIEAFVRPLEKTIISSSGSTTAATTTTGASTWRFTELGALRFDKDWRGLVAYLSEQATPSGEVRDKFARIQQIAYVLSLDVDEEGGAAAATASATVDGLGSGAEVSDDGIYESGAASGFSWRLSASEVKAVRSLRIA